MRIAIIILLCFVMGSPFLSGQNLYDSLKKIESGQISVSPIEYVELLDQLANSILYTNPDSAILYAESAMQHAQDHQLKAYEVETFNTLGRIYYVKGLFSEANRFFSQGLEAALVLGDQHLISQGYNSIGTILLVQGKYKEAIKRHLAGIQIAEEIEDTLLITKHYFNISNAYDDLSQYDSALFFAVRTIDIAKEAEDWHHLAMSYNRRAETYFNTGKYELAVNDHLQSLEVVPEKNKWEKAYAYSGLSKVYLAMGYYGQSLKMGKKSLNLGIEINALWELQNTTRFISEAFASLNQFDSAYHYHVLHKAYSDSVFNQQKEREINALHLQRVRLENLNLQQENRMKQDTIRQRDLMVWIVSIALFAAFGILFILYRKSSQKHKFSLELLEKNQEIEDQKEELKGLLQTKDKLLSIIAHDMKSPLNSLHGLIQMMKQKNVTPEQVENISQMAEEQVFNIVNTLNNLIEWVQSQFRGETFNPEVVNISFVIDEQLKLWSSQIDQKQLKVRHQLETDLQVRVDLQHLKVIVRNLINNAVKFSKEKGLLAIKYQAEGEFVNIQFIDEGVGISAKNIERILNSKVRSTKGTLNEEGTGLGLQLIKHYIDVNSGHLSIESEPGKGSTFTVTLPSVEI